MYKKIEQEAVDLSNELIEQLAYFGTKVRDKYDYYDNSQSTRNIGISLTKSMAQIEPGVGWVSRSISSITSRLNFEGFSGDRLSINKMMKDAGAVNAFNQARTDALIAGCSFVAISGGEDGFRVVPFNALEATGVIDENTGALKYGLAVTGWVDASTLPMVSQQYKFWPSDYALFNKTYTAVFEGGILKQIIPNYTNRPLIYQITYRQSIQNPMGQSRISRTARRIVDEVTRLKQRYEIAAEFYSAPRDYVNGLMLGDNEEKPTYETALGKMITITKDEDGEHPEIGRLPQASMDQFEEQKKGLARDFCAETSLPLSALGYETANPTSAEALNAMMDDLLLVVKDCQREMGAEFKNVALGLLMLNNNSPLVPEDAKDIKAEWLPYTQIDIGATGDALYKLFDIMPELRGSFSTYRMLGLGIDEAELLARASKRQSENKEQFMPVEKPVEKQEQEEEQ